MSYFQLIHHNKTITLDLNGKVTIKIPFTLNHIIIVTENGFYYIIHIDTQKIICNGKLSFIPLSYIQTYTSQFVYFYDQKFIARIDISDYENVIQQKYQINHQASPVNYYYLNKSSILSIVETKQLGLSMFVFNFDTKLWSNNVVLGKSYMAYRLIRQYQQTQQFFNFIVVANGEKLTSVNFCRIQYKDTQNALQTISAKNANIPQKFIVIGGTFIEQSLYLIGNHMNQNYQVSLVEVSLMGDFLPRLYKMYNQFSTKILMRKYIDIINDYVICQFSNNNQRYYATINFKDLTQLSLSILICLDNNNQYFYNMDKSGFTGFHLQCQEVLTKIKSAPTIININSIKKVGKKMIYYYLMESYSVDQILQETILSLL